MSTRTQKLAKRLILPSLIACLVACTSASGPAPRTIVTNKEPEHSARLASPVTSSGLLALEAARKMLGVSYRYAGTDPGGFDCSGLIQYSFNHAGVKLPRTSQEIFRNSQLISREDMQPGDLVFFAISPSKVSHVGIYDNGHRFIHAPSSGKGVSYADLEDPYWQQRLVGIGRF